MFHQLSACLICYGCGSGVLQAFQKAGVDVNTAPVNELLNTVAYHFCAFTRSYRLLVRPLAPTSRLLLDRCRDSSSSSWKLSGICMVSSALDKPLEAQHCTYDVWRSPHSSCVARTAASYGLQQQVVAAAAHWHIGECTPVQATHPVLGTATAVAQMLCTGCCYAGKRSRNTVPTSRQHTNNASSICASRKWQLSIVSPDNPAHPPACCCALQYYPFKGRPGKNPCLTILSRAYKLDYGLAWNATNHGITQPPTMW